MPKRTAIVLGLIAGGVLSLRYATWRHYGNAFLFSGWVLRIGEFTLLSVVAYWATLSRSGTVLRWSLVAAAGAFVVIETLALTPSMRPYRISWSAYLEAVPTVFGTICSSLVIGGWMAWRGRSLEIPRSVIPHHGALRILFTLREVFVLTLVCALLLGLTAQASDQFSIVGIDRWRYMLFFWLRALLFGVIAGAAALATLLPGAPWRRIIVGSSVCLMPLVILSWSYELLSHVPQYVMLLSYYVLHYLTLATLFWTFRSAGYRLVWRERASVGDNPAPAG